MKAKNLYYLMALCAGSFVMAPKANAQDAVVEDVVSVTEYSCDNTNRYFQSWRDIGLSSWEPESISRSWRGASMEQRHPVRL